MPSEPKPYNELSPEAKRDLKKMLDSREAIKNGSMDNLVFGGKKVLVDPKPTPLQEVIDALYRIVKRYHDNVYPDELTEIMKLVNAYALAYHKAELERERSAKPTIPSDKLLAEIRKVVTELHTDTTLGSVETIGRDLLMEDIEDYALAYHRAELAMFVQRVIEKVRERKVGTPPMDRMEEADLGNVSWDAALNEAISIIHEDETKKEE